MKTTVRLTAIFTLLMLLISTSGSAVGVHTVDRSEVCQFIADSSDSRLGVVQYDDQNLMHALTSSDVEYSVKLVTEIQLQNMRSRRVVEMYSALKKVLQILSLRDDLMSLDRNKMALDDDYVVLSATDHYVFGLRRILI